jgi:hypothetical protein
MMEEKNRMSSPKKKVPQLETIRHRRWKKLTKRKNEDRGIKLTKESKPKAVFPPQ